VSVIIQPGPSILSGPYGKYLAVLKHFSPSPTYLAECGLNCLVAVAAEQVKWPNLGIREGTMGLKISGATGLRTSVLAAALAVTVAAGGLAPTDAVAAPKKRHVAAEGRGPNYSYQSGPRTRVYISRRSWLDGGTEVLPGERKFTDYAYAPGYHYGRTIDRLNQARNPLSDNFDLGGYPTAFPLY
jgi:hypothetical protein